MKNDKYLRFILTVIAICLVWICIRDIAIGPSNLFANTNGRAPGVWIDGGEMDVNVTGLDETLITLAISMAEPISVTVDSPTPKSTVK